MFIGEGPSDEDDTTGEPFAGHSGQLLTKMIEAMGLTRDRVFITNVVKCRPPGNRNPEPGEISACHRILEAQIDLVAPQVIVCLGTVAAQTILGNQETIGKLRARFHELRRSNGAVIRVMPTYHPAFLLRNPDMKKPVWEDLRMVMAALKVSR